MAIPKLVKNGIYFPFALLICSLFPFAVQAARSDPNARKGIKTISYHFRNKHARCPRCNITLMRFNVKESARKKDGRVKYDSRGFLQFHLAAIINFWSLPETEGSN
jgi:hypothetical protein